MAVFKPYTVWTVSEDEEYKLVLEAQQIVELEEKLENRSLMTLLGDERTGMPSLRTMLLVTHAAMPRYNHGMKLSDVYSAFNRYIDGGGSQIDFYTSVYVKIFQVSGFFPRTQAEELGEALDSMNENPRQ